MQNMAGAELDKMDFKVANEEATSLSDYTSVVQTSLNVELISPIPQTVSSSAKANCGWCKEQTVWTHRMNMRLHLSLI